MQYIPSLLHSCSFQFISRWLLLRNNWRYISIRVFTLFFSFFCSGVLPTRRLFDIHPRSVANFCRADQEKKKSNSLNFWQVEKKNADSDNKLFIFFLFTFFFPPPVETKNFSKTLPMYFSRMQMFLQRKIPSLRRWGVCLQVDTTTIIPGYL